jgi:peptide maturation system protein (TIGR04066 family)
MKMSSALYPFSPQLLPFVKHFEQFQNEYSLCKLISLPGLALTGFDASRACNYPKINMVVSDTRDIENPGWDTLIVTYHSDESPVSDNNILEIIIQTLARGKSVVFCDDNRSEISRKIWALKEQFTDKLTINFERHTLSEAVISGKPYSPIQTPIILVGGLVECSDLLETVLNLASQFKMNNLHPSIIVKQPLGQLFGFHTINHIFSNPHLTEAKKTEEINRFVAVIEKEETPDVFIIEAPDAIMRFNELAPNGFGIRTYMVTQALCIDSIVCCAPFGLAYGSLLEGLSKDFSQRFGSPIHAVQVSNVVVDMADLIETYKVTCSYSDLSIVKKHIIEEAPNSSIPFFDVVSDGGEKLFAYLCNLIKVQNME